MWISHSNIWSTGESTSKYSPPSQLTAHQTDIARIVVWARFENVTESFLTIGGVDDFEKLFGLLRLIWNIT
jgi:hypothetical protein